MKRVFFTILFPFSHMAPHGWWESITLPFWRGGRELYPEQAQLSPMITVSQQVLHRFFSTSFAYLPSPPSLLLSSLNKSPASQGWDSSCCCLALIWCNDACNAPHVLPHDRKAEFIFQAIFRGGNVTLLLGLFTSSWPAMETLFSWYFGLIIQTKPAAIVSFWPPHTWQ